jgi:hypothetical protein
VRVLPKPQFQVSRVYAACVAAITDTAARIRLNTVASMVSNAELTYEAHAIAKTLHIVARIADIAGVVSADEMKDLYQKQMSSTKGGGRAYYDALKNAAPSKKCPLCGVGIVSSLDHHLPQSKYPDLAVSPYNLVPSCFDCNKAKHTKFPSTMGEQTIHPYFDDFSGVQWIHGSIEPGPPLTVRFEVMLPSGWDQVDGQRVTRHFTVFKLATLFAANANDELIVIKSTLKHLFEAGSDSAVRQHLVEQANIHSIRMNSWQHALYHALSNDVAFCQGGFAHIPDPQ